MNTVIVLDNSELAKVYQVNSLAIKDFSTIKTVSLKSLAKAFSQVKQDIELPVIDAETPPLSVYKIIAVKESLHYLVLGGSFDKKIRFKSKQRQEAMKEYKVTTPNCLWQFQYISNKLYHTRLWMFADFSGEATLLSGFSLGNSNDGVCWGSLKDKILNTRPTDIQKVISYFWSSEFNEDLANTTLQTKFLNEGKITKAEIKAGEKITIKQLVDGIH